MKILTIFINNWQKGVTDFMVFNFGIEMRSGRGVTFAVGFFGFGLRITIFRYPQSHL